MSKKINRIGHVTPNGWKIIKEDGKDNCGSVMWVGLCPLCKKPHRLTHKDMVRAKSCGCIKIKDPKDMLFKRKYSEYKWSAQNRNYEFELTLEEYKELVVKECFYCKQNIKQEYKLHRTGKEVVKVNPVSINGIDRVDNNKGYTLDNVVPCCNICNWMKRDLSFNEFANHINLIHRTLNPS